MAKDELFEQRIEKLNRWNKLSDKEKVLVHLIDKGEKSSDAKKMVAKYYDKVSKMYKNANIPKKAEIISVLSAKNEGSCGYGIDGKVGKEPAGPHLLKKKKKKVVELVPPMSVSNPAAYKTMLNKQISKNVKVKTALGNKDHKDHGKAKSLLKRFMDKFKKKKDAPKKSKSTPTTAADYRRSRKESKMRGPGKND